MKSTIPQVAVQENKNQNPSMPIADIIDKTTTEALKNDQIELTKFNNQAKEQSQQLTKGFENLITDTAKLTSGNSNDNEYSVPETSSDSWE